MATVYKQEWNKYDGKLGLVNFVFIVTDEYYECYNQTNPISVGIFDIGNTKEDLDIDVGVQVVDELSFSINAERIKTTIDAEALEFTLAGLDRLTPRYIVLFINPTSEGDVNAKIFDGQINFNGKATDIKWNDTQWGTNQIPDRNWDFTSKNIGYSLLDTISMPSLLVKLGIDDSWIADNVFNAEIILNFNLYNQVYLSDILTKIIDISLTDTIDGIRVKLPGFKINLLESYSSFYFTSGKPIWHKNGNIAGFEPEAVNPIQLKLIGMRADNSAIINWNMAFMDDANKTYGFGRYETVSELLYAIALSFGCYVKFETVAPDEINISFVPRQNLGATQTYIIDAESASLNIEYADDDNENIKFYGMANSYAIEGNDCYSTSLNEEGTAVPSQKATKFKQDGEQLLFSVSPTIYRLRDTSQTYIHNARLKNNPITKFYSPLSVITSIYQKADSLLTGVNTYSVQVAFKTGDETYSFQKLADCINALYAIDGGFYKSEYEITVPYLLGFSLNSDGSNNDWKHIILGNKINIDSIDYAIIGIERDYQNLFTKIRLHKSSQYLITQPPASLMTADISTISNFMYISGNSFIGTSAESLDVGIAVYLGSADQLWHYGYSETINGGLIGGVTLSSANINSEIIIIAEGMLAFDGLQGFENWNWTPGTNEGLFVRAIKGNESAITNISQNELTEKNLTEDFYIKIGYPVSPKEIILDFSEQWIFED